MSEFEDDYSDLEVEIEQSDEPESGGAAYPGGLDGSVDPRVGRGDRPARLWSRGSSEWALPSSVVLPCWERHGARAAARVPAR